VPFVAQACALPHAGDPFAPDFRVPSAILPPSNGIGRSVVQINACS
jgi:hypothetical protein